MIILIIKLKHVYLLRDTSQTILLKPKSVLGVSTQVPSR